MKRVLVAFFGCFVLVIAHGTELAPLPLVDFTRPTHVHVGPISPDGRYLVVFRTLDHRTLLTISDDDQNIRIQVDEVEAGSFQSWWIGQHTLLYSKLRRVGARFQFAGLYLANAKAGFNRLVRAGKRVSNPQSEQRTIRVHTKQTGNQPIPAASSHTRTRVVLAQTGNEEVAVRLIASMALDENQAVLTLCRGAKHECSAYRLEVGSATLTREANVPQHVVRWLADNRGRVRVAVQRKPDGDHVLYRASNNAPWREIADAGNGEIRLLSFTQDNEHILVASRKNRDRFAIYQLNPRSGKFSGPYYEDPQFDVMHVDTQPGSGKTLAIRYQGQMLRSVFLDAARSKLQAGIDMTLDDTVNEIESSSIYGDQHIVEVYGDRQPARYFRLYGKRNIMIEIANSRRWIDPQLMSPMHAVSFKARDGKMRFGYLTTPVVAGGNGAHLIIVLHGKLGEKRFQWRFNPLFQLLANRGFAVLALDHVGTSGLGSAFQAAGGRSWKGALMPDIEDAIGWAVAAGHVKRGNVCVLGRQRSAVAAISALQLAQPAIDCAIAIDPQYGTELAGTVNNARLSSARRLLLVTHGTATKQPTMPGGNLELTQVHLARAEGDPRGTAAWKKLLQFLQSWANAK